MHQRPAWPHRDLPERQRHAFGRERLLHQIVFANRRAAGRDQHVGVGLAGAADGGNRVVEPVRNDAEIHNLGALRARERHQAEAVGVDDLARTGGGPRRHQFVAGREQRDAWPPMDRHRRVVHRCREHEVARGQAVPRCQQHIAGLEVEPLDAHVLAAADRPW